MMRDGATPPEGAPDRGAVQLHRRFVLLATTLITVVFVLMIRSFVQALLLAGITTGLVYPAYRWLVARLRGRRVVAAVLTLAMVLVVIVGPLLTLLGLVVSQAAQTAEEFSVWFEESGRTPGVVSLIEERVPLARRLEPLRDEAVEKAGELAGQLGSVVLKWIGNTTRSTLRFLLQFFVFLYAVFFFLLDGPELVRKMLYYMPLSDEEEARMLGKFVSVSRATLKGTLVVGIVQGALAGLAFAVAGIGGWVLWGTLMTVLAIIPGIGAALIWVPAVAYLMLTGSPAAGIALAIWCIAVVSTVDNFLRPRLVGSDTEMPDLLILLGTLGGLLLFGAAGIIVGPIVAALFVTIWEIYGSAFRQSLEPASAAGDGSGGAGGE
jgi:predicted PurR-regulated permease PerM